MKLLPFLALSILLLLSGASVRADAKDDKVVQQLAGKWEATFKGDAVTFEFGADETFTLGAKGDVMKGSFTVDASEEPWKMDLDGKGKNARQGYTIFRINADGTMDWVEPRDEEENRPTEFKKSFSFTKSGAAAPPAPAAFGSIVGSWEGKADGDLMKATFTADGKCTIDEGDGPENGTYKLDKSVTPHRLDFSADKTKRTVFCLCQFIGDKLKLSEPADSAEERGKDFGDLKTALLSRIGAKEPATQALDPKLVGKWKGNTDDEKIIIEFKADGTFSLQKNEKDAISGTYSTQPETTPAQIDLTLGEKSGLAIYRIEGDRLTMTEPDNRRAKNFDAKDVLLAQKVK